MIQVETISIPKQIFKSRVAGVTFENSDGTKRQEIIKNSKRKEKIYLERDYENEFDDFAIKVLNEQKKQIGFLPTDRNIRLSRYIDSGGETTSFIYKKTGGKTFWDKLFSIKGKPLGCIIEICKTQRFNEEKSKRYDDFSMFDNSIRQQIEQLHLSEKNDINASIKNYKEIVDIIKDSDKKGNFERANRFVQIPINRLTLLLEKSKDYSLAIKYIQWYYDFKDTRGITKSDLESINKRYDRLIKKQQVKNL